MVGKVILIEGLDLAGKSTLVENLRVELTRRGIPVRVSRNALCPENPIAALADRLRRDPSAGLVETGAMFLAAHLWDARHFVQPADGMIHIQDSCWLRTLAYHCSRGTPGVARMLDRARPSFPRFDATVFITASIDERRSRLVEREQQRPGANDDGDLEVVHDPESFCATERLLLRSATKLCRARIINTTELSRQGVLLAALRLLKFN
jgi:thymidylate kinase